MNRNIAEELATKLLKETHLENIVWSIKEPPFNLENKTENFISIYLETTYKGKIIGLFEKRLKHYHDEDIYDWVSEANLCIVEEKATRRISTWEGGGSKATRDLLFYAKAKASGVLNLLE